MRKFSFAHKISCTEVDGRIFLDGKWIGHIKSERDPRTKFLWYRYIDVTQGDANTEAPYWSKPYRQKSEAIRQLLISWYTIDAENRRGLYPDADHEGIAFHKVVNVKFTDHKGFILQEKFVDLTAILWDIMADYTRLTGLLEERRKTALPVEFSPSNPEIFHALQRAEAAMKMDDLQTVLANHKYLLTTRKWKQ